MEHKVYMINESRWLDEKGRIIPLNKMRVKLTKNELSARAHYDLMLKHNAKGNKRLAKYHELMADHNAVYGTPDPMFKKICYEYNVRGIPMDVLRKQEPRLRREIENARKYSQNYNKKGMF